MTSLTEVSVFDAGVYELEITDPVQGGASGTSNVPLKNLANRTRWLYDQLATVVASLAGFAPIAAPTFTGNAAAPTPGAGDNTTRLATTAFVQTAFSGIVTVNVAGGANVTLSQAQWGAGILILTGALTANINLVFPTNSSGRNSWIIANRTTGPSSVTCKTAGGSGAVVTQGATREIFGDGGNILASNTDYLDASLTGSPTSTTAPPSDSSTRISTTAFVVAAVAALVGGAPANLDTLGKIAIALGGNPAFAATVTAALAAKAPLNSPILTGTPTAVTQVAGDNTLKIATTAFVQTAVSSAVTALVGGAPGALDTLNELAIALANDAGFASTMTNALALKAPLNSPVLAGTPTAPTPAGGDNTQKLATTAFVQTAVATAVSTIAPVPTGAVFHFAMGSTPGGYLVADGSAVSRTTYGALFALVATTYGAGDGSTTFNLPDLRGEFIRALDLGRGLDPGRALGSYQADDIISHNHGIPVHSQDSSSAAVADGTGPTSNTAVTQNTGGTETRPKNIALVACIKT
jgi:microcystin-dependent protein